ncbi:hypothetical protein TSAR_000516 [Trichomalopsis sarcophagae]|uniref:Uncharacterized protein n=1 Tax=Trichomalopsis sarcophagae TaxID=543379 RepID=A0A232EIA3_9HYME|nr:hypothetical protein TSAR_000516 [Trichomalopsis sarcophagae]
MATTAERGTGLTEAKRLVHLLEVSLSQRPTSKSDHSFSRYVGRSLKKRSRSFRERRCFPFVYKNPSPVSSKISKDHSSSDLGAFAENQQYCFPFVYKNPRTVSSEMSIDHLTSAVNLEIGQERCFPFVHKNPRTVFNGMSVDHSSSDLGAFANKCALKTDYLELDRCFSFVYKNPSPVSSVMSIDSLTSVLNRFLCKVVKNPKILLDEQKTEIFNKLKLYYNKLVYFGEDSDISKEKYRCMNVVDQSKTMLYDDERC